MRPSRRVSAAPRQQSALGRALIAQPPRPTLVVHNGSADPYPGAWESVAVNGSGDGSGAADPDIAIEQRGDRLHLGTKAVQHGGGGGQLPQRATVSELNLVGWRGHLFREYTA